jgi:hypothetical protein
MVFSSVFKYYVHKKVRDNAGGGSKSRTIMLHNKSVQFHYLSYCDACLGMCPMKMTSISVDLK